MLKRAGGWRSHPWGPAGRVSGGLEAAKSKGVLGLDGIKMHRMAGGLLSSCPPMQRKQAPLPSYTWSM